MTSHVYLSNVVCQFVCVCDVCRYGPVKTNRLYLRFRELSVIEVTQL
jgi:hypothetical protein